MEYATVNPIRRVPSCPVGRRTKIRRRRYSHLFKLQPELAFLTCQSCSVSVFVRPFDRCFPRSIDGGSRHSISTEQLHSKDLKSITEIFFLSSWNFSYSGNLPRSMFGRDFFSHFSLPAASIGQYTYM